MLFSKVKIFVLTVICFLFGMGFTYAQHDGEQNFEIIESVNDSIDLRSNFYDDADSLSEYFPASDLYESWDNDGIYYPKVDFSAKKDTTVIVLCDEKTNFFVEPVKGRINSEYGYRHRRFHYGIDINLNIGDSVKCAFDGMVRVSRYHKGYGNVVVVRHFNGLETVYGHMSAAIVRENQLVKAGTLLGFGGSTGHSTGPHLHFEIRYLGSPMNPRKVVDFTKFQLYCDTLLITNKTFEKAHSNSYVSKSSGSSQKSYNSSYKGAGNFHYVKKGETLGHIAGMYHTSLANIYRLNGLSSKSVLQIGQKIRVK